MGEIYGGFLCSHSLNDDILFCYGSAFGTRLKIVMITKNYQGSKKKEIKDITRAVHGHYMEYLMNPLKEELGSKAEEMLEEQIMGFLKENTCDYLAQENNGNLVISLK